MAYPKYPETKEEWWRFVDENWDNLMKMFQRFAPLNDLYEDENGYLGNINLGEHIINLKMKRDPKLARELYKLWAVLPDQEEIHSICGFYTLCDLLSEEFALYEEE